MSKKALEIVIDDENFWNKIKKQPLVEISTLTETQATELFHSIDGKLSPENLHCDGEISVTQARRKYRELTGAAKELKAMGFSVPNGCYELDI